MELLSQAELQKIKDDFCKIVRYSQGVSSEIPLDYSDLFDHWEQNKKRFIELFEGLIWESPEPISITLNSAEKERQMALFYAKAAKEISMDFYEFLDANNSGFFDNEVKIVPNNAPSEIKPGMKLLRAFKYFISDETNLRKWQDMASEIIQMNKFEGTLCLSVHPLDFLSLSENASGWRSCHALDGEFCAGNLSYMADAVTFICYIKNKGNCILEHFPPDISWNSKKWRMLMHITENGEVLWLNRQYPFENYDIVKAIYDITPMRKLHFSDPIRWNSIRTIKMGRWESSWQHGVPEETDNYTLEENHLLLDGVMHPMHRIIKSNGLQYNDLVKSPYFIPAYSSASRWFFPEIKDLKITIGAPVLCPICGQPLDSHEDLVCNHCSEAHIEHIYCHRCDMRLLPNSDIIWDNNGTPYCPECWAEMNEEEDEGDMF